MVEVSENYFDIDARWEKLSAYIKKDFNKKLDVNAALFLIGIQELGQGFKNFTKEQKQDLMHIANCKILSFSGYFKLVGLDADGWPHWEKIKDLPYLKLNEQELFLKHHILVYFSDIYEI